MAKPARKTPEPIPVWVVTHPEGHLGIFATEKLALDHAALITDGLASVETDIVRHEPMRELLYPAPGARRGRP